MQEFKLKFNRYYFQHLDTTAFSFCSQFNLIMWTSVIGQFVHPVGGKGWDKQGGWGVIVILAILEYHFIRVH